MAESTNERSIPDFIVTVSSLPRPVGRPPVPCFSTRLAPPGTEVSTLTLVSSEIDTRGNDAEEPAARERDGLLSAFGVASAVLGVVCIAAIVLTYLIWSSHREQKDELAHKAQVVQTAVNWAGVLINLNK